MNKNTRIMFLRDSNRKPVGCVAMQLHKNRKTIRYQISTWNPVDQFDRALARQIALGRMLEKPKFIQLNEKIETSHQVTSFVMKNIILNEQTPTRSQRAAMLWFDKNKIDFHLMLNEL